MKRFFSIFAILLFSCSAFSMQNTVTYVLHGTYFEEFSNCEEVSRIVGDQIARPLEEYTQLYHIVCDQDSSGTGIIYTVQLILNSYENGSALKTVIKDYEKMKVISQTLSFAKVLGVISEHEVFIPETNHEDDMACWKPESSRWKWSVSRHFANTLKFAHFRNAHTQGFYRDDPKAFFEFMLNFIGKAPFRSLLVSFAPDVKQICSQNKASYLLDDGRVIYSMHETASHRKL